MPRTKKAKPVQTTAQQLSALIKSVRQILRKDKGLNGDADRLPLLTWVMFLKFLDDLETRKAEEAAMDGRKYEPLIEPPYRWRDWAARPDGINGEELLAFLSQDKAPGPDGKRRAGLFAYLRSLADREANGGQRRVISNVFKGVQNRMVSGYLLRDVINKINQIHFNSSEEVHTLSHLYESMLREMRDAAGDSGEFYTPRPVVHFMVQVTNPQLGETVLDPACGTGGFLVEAFDHLNQQVKGDTKQRELLHQATLYGQEAKPLPYMLAEMNLLLHGLDAPQIAYGNTLAQRLNEIGHGQRVDVILTNPPFGGEEEAGIKANFPPNLQTSETALLFLQYIMRMLRHKDAPVPARGRLRKAGRAERGGRAAVVVPNGTLFGDGVAALIKEQLLKDFNLHTIVRMPQGVFAPYTDIPANLLFFERGGPTKNIWYYEIPLPEGRKKYSKTAPMQFEEFADCLAWWKRRKEGPQAWKVKASDVIKNGYNLDLKNPSAKRVLEDVTAPEVIDRIFKCEDQIVELFVRKVPRTVDGGELNPDLLLKRLNLLASRAQVIQESLRKIDSDAVLLLALRFRDAIVGAPYRPMSEVAPVVRREVAIDPDTSYTELGVRSFYKGTFHRRTVAGSEFTWQKMYRVEAHDLIFSNIMAWEQAIALARPEDHGCVGNHRMLTCLADRQHVLPAFLAYYFTTEDGFAKVYAASPGTAARNRTLVAGNLEAIEVPTPPLAAQQAFVDLQGTITSLKGRHAAIRADSAAMLPSVLERTFVQ